MVQKDSITYMREKCDVAPTTEKPHRQLMPKAGKQLPACNCCMYIFISGSPPVSLTLKLCLGMLSKLAQVVSNTAAWRTSRAPDTWGDSLLARSDQVFWSHLICETPAWQNPQVKGPSRKDLKPLATLPAKEMQRLRNLKGIRTAHLK